MQKNGSSSLWEKFLNAWLPIDENNTGCGRFGPKMPSTVAWYPIDVTDNLRDNNKRQKYGHTMTLLQDKAKTRLNAHSRTQAMPSC